MNATHIEQLSLWREREIVTKAVKNQLTSVFGTSFTAELHDNYTGCSNANIQETLDLHENYREFDENDVESNGKTLNKSFIMMESFTTFSKRIENCIDTAEVAGALHTDTQITNKVFSIILKAHIFHNRVQEQRRKSSANKA